MEARKEGPFAPEVMPPFMRGEGLYEYSKLYLFLARLADKLLPIFFKFTIEGLENVPDDGCIIAPNHDNAFDTVPFTYLHIYFGLPIHWLAKIELFGEHEFYVGKRRFVISAELSTWFFYGVRCIPITRGKPEREPIYAVPSILRAHCIVGIFPTGTRNKEGAELKKALFRWAQKTGVPVVPTLLRSTMPSLWPPRQGTFHLKYGAPIYASRDADTVELTEVLRKAMTELGCSDH